MKKKKSIICKSAVLAAAVALVCLAFAACGDTVTEEVSAPESTTTTITEITTDITSKTAAATKATTNTTAKATETADKATTEKADTTTVKAAEPIVEKKTAAAQQQVTPKATPAKPAQQTPVKATTAAPTGHYETVHHEAVTEQVWVVDIPCGSQIDPAQNCKMHIVVECYCGQFFNSIDQWDKHSDDAWINNGDDSHWGYRYWYVSDEDIGHYETKIVKAAYDEQVWVQE